MVQFSGVRYVTYQSELWFLKQKIVFLAYASKSKVNLQKSRSVQCQFWKSNLTKIRGNLFKICYGLIFSDKTIAIIISIFLRVLIICRILCPKGSNLEESDRINWWANLITPLEWRRKKICIMTIRWNNTTGEMQKLSTANCMAVIGWVLYKVCEWSFL